MDERAERRRIDEVEAIRVRGARVHNLQNVDIDLPRDRLVVLTGPSGSGKSSLAFDTIFAEGQRRYIESLSAYARQFLDQLEPPDVDSIEGLPPTVAIDQRANSPGPRSTVATMTEIHDSLRLAYARLGEPHCPECDHAIQRQSPEQMVDQISNRAEGLKVLLLAPLVKGRKGQHLDAFAKIRREGLIRARVDGEVIDVTEQPPKLDRAKNHTIEAVVDRLILRPGIRARLAESVDRAIKLGNGTIIVLAEVDGRWEDTIHSIDLACPECGISIEPHEPRDFSFNSPHGACPRCDGLGLVADFERGLVIDDSKSVSHGAIASAVWDRHEKEIVAFLEARKIRKSTRMAAWPRGMLDEFWEGTADWPGLSRRLDEAWQSAKGKRLQAALESMRAERVCPECDGTRLKRSSRGVRLRGLALPDVLTLHVAGARAQIGEWRFEGTDALVAEPILREVGHRLAVLEEVGLGYLTLDRRAATLSGGEIQRVRLASQIGSGLIGICYVFDEPTAGLHPCDTDRLLKSLFRLRDLGNSVLVVEHDVAMMRAADWLVDLGPGAGPDGGRIVASGNPNHLNVTGASATAKVLAGAAAIGVRTDDRLAKSAGWIAIRGASEHNLTSFDVEIPRQTLVAVTGPSGSGKSTLVFDILSRVALRCRPGAAGGMATPAPGTHARIEGLSAIERVAIVDQSPIGRTARSTPATYVGVFDEIRRLYAQTREARIRGYAASRFSFNVKGGRCEVCGGQGMRNLEMEFLPSISVTCEACHGRRYNSATLEAKYKGLSIADALALRVDEAMEVFDSVPSIMRGLRALSEAGLGYVTLGQPSSMLSGGEAQRVKLAAELGGEASSGALYLLDEPTTGLHPIDVERLMHVLNRLVDGGATVVVVEHQMDVVAGSDWVIDLGPGGGDAGGRLIFSGPPKALLKCEASATGRALRDHLAHSRYSSET